MLQKSLFNIVSKGLLQFFFYLF